MSRQDDSSLAPTSATLDLEKCPKCGDELYYYPACNEDGWRCCRCEHKPGEPPGFDPERDRELVSLKVHGLLLDLHEHDFIYCSNSGHGDAVCHAAAERCRETGLYDQYSIIRFIFESQARHGEYWKEISEGVLSGNDNRDRCSRGNLARMYSAGEHYCLDKGCDCRVEHDARWAATHARDR